MRKRCLDGIDGFYNPGRTARTSTAKHANRLRFSRTVISIRSQKAATPASIAPEDLA